MVCSGYRQRFHCNSAGGCADPPFNLVIQHVGRTTVHQSANRECTNEAWKCLNLSYLPCLQFYLDGALSKRGNANLHSHFSFACSFTLADVSQRACTIHPCAVALLVVFSLFRHLPFCYNTPNITLLMTQR